MNPDDFRSSPSGRLVPSLDGVMAFVPNSLDDLKLELGGMVSLISRADHCLGELSGIGRTLQNPYLLLRPFLRKEAVASSKIEGTVTTLSELLVYEAGAGGASSDTIEVRNYSRALEYGISRLNELPVSSRLILELHNILMSNVRAGRGDHITPGEYRRDQNWIGARLIQNARFVPPPPSEVEREMGSLENYIHDHESEKEIPLIVKIALIHYQFETIHPFPDGNGRIGRLLIPLILAERHQMSHPLLYLSSYFEKNYEKYIDLMHGVSRTGDWNSWIVFFLEAVESSSHDAIKKAKAIQDLHSEYRRRIQTARSSALLGRLLDDLFNIPAVTVPYAQAVLKTSYNAAKNNIERLVQCGILTRRGVDQRPAWYFAEEIVSVTHRDET